MSTRQQLDHSTNEVIDALYQTCAITVTDADVIQKLLLWHYQLTHQNRHLAAHKGDAVALVKSLLSLYTLTEFLFPVCWYCHMEATITPGEIEVLRKHLDEKVHFPSTEYCKPR